MLSKKETVKYLVIFLLLLPILMLLLSNTLDLLQDSPPMLIDNPSEVISYYLRPTQGGIAQFFNFLWMLWPGLFLYLWKQKKIRLQEHLFYHAYPFVLFLSTMG